MLKATVTNNILKTLPDDRPITSIQVIESLDKCPTGFFPVSRTYDQDQDADLWREGSFFKRSSARYLCLSKTKGLPDFVVHSIIVLSDKSLPPEGYSILSRTVDSDQKAWRKKQLGYRMVNRKTVKQAVTDIIVCSRLKKAPEGFILSGEINGVTICYKMGNTQDTQSGATNGQNGIQTPPDRPPRPAASLTGPSVYPSLSDGDHDYEILRPGHTPSRPAPPTPHPPFTHQHSTHTLSNFHSLDGVPFIVNPKFLNSTTPNKLLFPTIKSRTMQQLLKEYDYSFTVERQT